MYIRHMQLLLRNVLNMLYDEKEKIFKYTMLIERTKEQVITTTLDTYMDVIGAYKQKIKGVNERIAYLEAILQGILHLET